MIIGTVAGGGSFPVTDLVQPLVSQVVSCDDAHHLKQLDLLVHTAKMELTVYRTSQLNEPLTSSPLLLPFPLPPKIIDPSGDKLKINVNCCRGWVYQVGMVQHKGCG